MRVVESKNSFENNALIGSLITTLKNKKKFNIPSSEILENGEYPVISQDKKFISGYSDDDNFVLDASESSSYLVFGDHTCVIKNIKFPFIIGADGTQVFSSNEKIVLNDFLYYYILSGRAVSQNGYKRHFKELKEKSISYPCLEEQKTIVDFLNKKNIQIEKIETLISKMEQRNQYYLNETLKSEGFVKTNLGELCTIKTGKLNANASSEDGKYPFFTCSRKISRIDDYAFDQEAILVAGNGVVGETKYYEGKFNAYQRTYVLGDFKIPAKYIFHYMKAFFQKRIEREVQGGVISYIKIDNIKDFEIHYPEDENKFNETLEFIESNERELELVKQLYSKEKQVFQWLCEKLVSGEYKLEE